MRKRCYIKITERQKHFTQRCQDKNTKEDKDMLKMISSFLEAYFAEFSHREA